jgi:hypothetical protein
MRADVFPAVRDYQDRGWSVIPTARATKRPLVAWREFQDRRPGEEEARAWWRRHPDAGVGIVCGRVSRLVVLDVDPRNGGDVTGVARALPPTPTVETGGGGRHFYFALPPGVRIPKVPALLAGVDLQGEASYVIAPPSVHSSGRVYRWLGGRELDGLALAPLPPVIRHLLALAAHPRRASVGSGRGRALHESLRSLDGILARLHRVRRVGRQWRAACPAHDDREPSLSVGRGENGRVLFFCHAGCAYRDVLRALGVEASP